MITIAELFPRFSTAIKWQSIKTEIPTPEKIRLEKEYTMYYKDENVEKYYLCQGPRYRGYEYTHRRDGPAVVYYQNGIKYLEEWYIDALRHRLYYPAVIRFLKGSTRIVEESWYNNGILHRLDGPAIIEYNTYCEKRREEWYYRGLNHNLHGPAVIVYNRHGWKISEDWYNNGDLHRTDGPAVIFYNDDGTISITKFFVNNNIIEQLV